MKKVILGGLCLWAAVGCGAPPTLMEQGQQAPKTGSLPAAAPARPAQVRPESVTESNAAAKAKELEQELEYDLQHGGKAP
jgi:hypothetical protein